MPFLRIRFLVLAAAHEGLAALLQVKPLYMRVHSQHHEIGSAITALGTAFGDAADIGLCFVAFHLVLGYYLTLQQSWNLAAVVFLIIFEVRSSHQRTLPNSSGTG